MSESAAPRCGRGGSWAGHESAGVPDCRASTYRGRVVEGHREVPFEVEQQARKVRVERRVLSVHGPVDREFLELDHELAVAFDPHTTLVVQHLRDALRRRFGDLDGCEGSESVK